MKKSDEPAFLGGDRWDAHYDFPNEIEILHYWKIVRPYLKHKGISSEEDAFRKRINDTVCQQLNIYSEIKLDSVVTRSGLIFYAEAGRGTQTVEMALKKLNTDQIDSVAKSWGLNYLVRNIH